MPIAILRTVLALVVIVGAVPQSGALRHFPARADSQHIADVALAETTASSPALPAIAPHPSANQFNITQPRLSEPLLLLLTGMLLIAVGTSLRRLTRSRRQPRTARTRQT